MVRGGQCELTGNCLPGYAIIDRLYVYGGTPYIVADGPADLAGAEDIVASSCSPSGETTVSRCGTTSAAVKIVTVKEAREIFGRFIHKIPGVAVCISTLRMAGCMNGNL